jgi:hypothetical protein
VEERLAFPTAVSGGQLVLLEPLPRPLTDFRGLLWNLYLWVSLPN